jgi:hypothetical protein
MDRSRENSKWIFYLKFVRIYARRSLCPFHFLVFVDAFDRWEKTTHRSAAEVASPTDFSATERTARPTSFSEISHATAKR